MNLQVAALEAFMNMKETENNGEEYVKIAVLESIVEAQIIGSLLDEEQIPHLIRSYHDTAYDGLFQFQRGWGELRAPLSHQADILRLLDEVRSENIEINETEEGGQFMSGKTDFEKAVETGRPPNVVKLFPNSEALIVSGKYIDLAMLQKGKAMSIAANGRNSIVIRGALLAAQRANSGLIIEIAKSEGGAGAYCAINFWNLARYVDTLCNELKITIPVALHADHYGIKSEKDVETAKTEIPTLFEAGITSIAIDASHLPDDKNLLASLELYPFVPDWAGFETEVGEIKGKEGLSTVEEALFLIQGLNAHSIFPNWIALNNGSTHGIEASDKGIQVDLTQQIHNALEKYNVSGAQHGTSGNNSDRLRAIAANTRTTKANVATALQMIAWGLEVNDYGNAQLDADGNFIKVKDQGVTEELWADMTAYAQEKGLKGGNYKKLNLPFENRILGQPEEVRERMTKRVEDFVYNLLVNVFNAQDTGPLAIEEILKAGSYNPGQKAEKIENPEDWTREKIIERAASINSDKGPAGDFDD